MSNLYALKLARAARPRCNRCFDDGLVWMASNLLTSMLPQADRVDAMAALVSAGPGGFAWLCPRCTNWGIFER